MNAYEAAPKKPGGSALIVCATRGVPVLEMASAPSNCFHKRDYAWDCRQDHQKATKTGQLACAEHQKAESHTRHRNGEDYDEDEHRL